MIEEIKYKKKILAYIIKYKKKNGTNFLTPERLTYQIAFIKHKKNHIISPHFHLRNIRRVNITSEILIIKKGRLRIDFYIKKNKYFFSKILLKNHIIVLLSGGHGFRVLKPIEMIEIKQGPYKKEKDKILLKKIDEKNIIIK